jgi:hypothetical protein
MSLISLRIVSYVATTTQGDLFIHTPSRAKYKPKQSPQRNAFYTVIVRDDFVSQGVELPFNLPQQSRRVSGPMHEQARAPPDPRMTLAPWLSHPDRCRGQWTSTRTSSRTSCW